MHAYLLTYLKGTPTLKEIEAYWNNIWGTTGHFNNSREWLNVLEKSIVIIYNQNIIPSIPTNYKQR